MQHTKHSTLLAISKRLSISVSSLPRDVDQAWLLRIWDRWVEERNPKLLKWLQGQRRKTVDFVEALNTPTLVIELGCGTGRITWDLIGHENVVNILSIDINKEAILQAQENIDSHSRGPKVLYVVADLRNAINLAHRLIVYAQSNNWRIVIVALEVLFHLSNVQSVIDQLFVQVPNDSILIGNLKTNDGLFMQSVLNRGPLLAVYSLIRTYLIVLFQIGLSGLGVCAHNVAEVRQMLSKFEIIKLETDELYHWFVCVKKFEL